MSRKKEDPQPIAFQPPASMEAEQACLGALLIRPELMDEAVDVLHVEDFYREAHGRIYQVMLWLYTNNMPVDLVTVCQQLRDSGQLEAVGGPAFLAGLSENVGFATNFKAYATTVRKKALLRRLLDSTQEIAGACLSQVDDVDAFLDEAEDKIYQIKDNQQTQVAFALSDLVDKEATRIEEIYRRKAEVLGVPSGFSDLDYLTGGWQNSDLIILAARTSMGKTSMAVNLSHYAADKKQTPVAFFSLEQPKEQLVQRLMASTGHINGTRLRQAKMDGEEWSKLAWVSGQLFGLPIYIIDRPALTVLEIRSQARRLKSRHGIGLVVIDYLQLARDPKAKSREQEIGSISRSLKALAKELNVPVIALAQLSRECEKRPNKRPILSDLRESGSIEQDADLVIFIYRDEVYKGQESKELGLAEIHLAKQRNGPTGKITLFYRAEYMKFENYQGDR